MSPDEPFQEDEGEPLVAAMTRPTMVGGLTLASLVMSFYIPGMAAMISRSVLPAIAIPFLLLASYLVCLKDVYLFDILTAATHLKTCRNKRFWRCRRYESASESGEPAKPGDSRDAKVFPSRRPMISAHP